MGGAFDVCGINKSSARLTGSFLLGNYKKDCFFGCKQSIVRGDCGVTQRY